MRVFYLHLNRDDFQIAANGIFWQSDAIDLYFNSSYQNYSLVRSAYGLGAVQPMMGGTTPNNVWVGMKYASPYPIDTDIYDDIDSYDSDDIYSGSTPNDIVFTDSGFILDNRFVDTSGSINLVNFNIISPEYFSDVSLTMYETNSPTSIFPEEWTVSNVNVTAIDGLYVNRSPRYVRFQLKWNYDPGNIDFYLRVEIDVPVMMPRYAETTNVLAKFPSWMAISELAEGNPNSATPALASNTSIGGKYINAVAGEWLDDLRQQISYRQQQLFINSADIYQKAWAYKSTVSVPYPDSFVGDGIRCVIAYSLTEFLQAQNSEDIVFWDADVPNIVYSNKLYNTFEINYVACPQEMSQIWNSFDDLGLLVNLRRLPGEGNISFQSRILDVYINRPGAGLLNFQNAIRRELNLWQFYGSTPNSYFVGATPGVLEIADILQDPHYTLPNGLPTTKLIRLVNYLAKQYPSTWGEFAWNEAFADLTNNNYDGYGLLPELMDATPWEIASSGVGDLKDLVVYPPSNVTGPHDFNVKFNIQGKAQQANTFFAPLALNLTVTANGAKDTYNNPTTTTWLTLEFTQYSSATVSYYSFELSSISDVNNQPGSTPTPASLAALRVFDLDGGTNKNITLFDTITSNSINGRLFITDISSVKLYPGRWDPGTHSFVNIPISTDYIAWFSNNPSNTLHNGGPADLEVDNNSATPTLLPPLTVLMQSTQVFHATDTWFAETIPLSTVINNSPNGVQAPGIVTLPNLNWDPYVTTGQNIQITIDSITVQKPDGTLTAIAVPDIDIGIISTNLYDSNNNLLSSGSLFQGNGFSTNLADALNASTIQLSLSGNLAAQGILAYPIIQNTTFYFTANQITSVTGLVDENGPWVGGYAPSAGNANFLYGSYSFSLDDFDLPVFTFPTSNSIETIITSINVQDYGDDAIISWLDRNTVTQAADGKFGPFNLHVRLNPEPNPNWNPLVHAGTYFEDNQESYFYIEPVTYSTNTTNSFFALPSLVQQGAPILGFHSATPDISNALRQVAFFSSTSPHNLTLTNTEIITGNYSNQLFAAYPNITNILVTDITDPNNKQILHLNAATSPSNVITVASPSFTTIGNTYQLEYEVKDSFYLNNSYQAAWPPSMDGYTITATPDYSIAPQAVIVTNSTIRPLDFVYEGAAFQSATPIGVALSPFHNTIEEGFLYLSNEDYPFDHLIIDFSSQIMRQGDDFIMVTITSYDVYNNPKPNVTLDLSLNFAHFGFDTSLSTLTITTDQYGFANFMINSLGVFNVINQPLIDSLNISTTGNFVTYNYGIQFNQPGVTFSGLQTVTYNVLQEFLINPKPETNPHILRGTVAHPSITSDGYNAQLIYGLLTDPLYNPIPHATVNWVKGRSNFDLFAPNGMPAASGQVVTNTNGSFQVGPFNSDVVPGYWLMSLEMSNATPGVGDIVYWLEYPSPLQNIIEMVGLPDEVEQLATPVGVIPSYNAAWEHPVYYNNAEPVVSATPNHILNWIPPTWFPLPVFDQWEYNMFQANPGSVTQDWADYLYQNMPPNTNYEF